MTHSPNEIGSAEFIDVRTLRPYRLANFVLLIALMAITGLLAAGRVTGDSRVALPVFGTITAETCLFKRAHGVECSSCGITRSVVAAFNGDFQQSREFHASGIAVALFLLLQIGLRGVFSLRTCAPYWKWDAILTTLSIVVCFGRFIVQIPNPV